jgi:Skp family chaperone for outer membrane proteins
MNSKLLGAAVAALALAAAAGAHAQHKSGTATRSSSATSTASPAVAATPLKHGPAIPGLCVFSNTAVMQTSSVGKAYIARMQQLRSQAAAEIGGQQTQLQNDEKALVAKRSTLSQQQLEQQAQPLQQREQALNATAEQRQRDLQYTAVRQQERIAAAIQPIATSVYEQHNCSLLLNGDTVMAENPAMDITQEVVSQLNGRMSTITFDRETAPAQ